jgi:hypothetical protein
MVPDGAIEGGDAMALKIVRRGLMPLLYLLASVLAPGADAVPAGFEKFYGEWAGTAVSDTGGEIAPRDIRAKITPQGNGFSITWVLVIHKPGSKDKRSEMSITFQPTKRPNIYSSAMRADAFGNATPLDPLRGDPYVWARIEGTMLIIYALVITEAGGYEMHTYERTLTPAGLMKLTYFRVINGEVLRSVTGTLKRGT